MDLQIAGRRAVVTGGSRGIGREIARQLAMEGARPVVCSRDLARARLAAEQLGAETGADVDAETVELRDAQSISEMVGRVASRHGGVDILINCGASVSGYVSERFGDVTDDFILGAFDEKVLGSLRCCRAVVPLMQEHQWGSVVNICGHSARVAMGISAGARNAAMVALTKNLAVELGRSGVRVNAVHPSTTVTETLNERMRASAAWRQESVDDHLRRLQQESSLGRLVTASEVAAVALFLASPLSGGITGEVIAVTGGAGRAIHY